MDHTVLSLLLPLPPVAERRVQRHVWNCACHIQTSKIIMPILSCSLAYTLITLFISHFKYRHYKHYLYGMYNNDECKINIELCIDFLTFVSVHHLYIYIIYFAFLM